jgi:hypothetical protein
MIIDKICGKLCISRADHNKKDAWNMGGGDMEDYDPNSEELWDDLRQACGRCTQTKGQCCLIVEEMIGRSYTQIAVGEVGILIQHCFYCGRKLE